MIELEKNMLNNNSNNLVDLLRDGATIIDVRSEREFAIGNIPNSINIPLQKIINEVDDLKLRQPLVLCCASGMRSSMAVRTLKESGIMEVYNGGSWEKIEMQLTN